MPNHSPLRALALATPSYSSSFCVEYVMAILGLQQECFANAIPFQHLLLTGVSIVDVARNRLANRFLWETEATHMLFVDDDMGFGVPEVMQMFDHAQADVVGAMYPRKSFDWARVKQVVLSHPDIDPAILPALAGDYRNMFTLPNNAPTLTVGAQPVVLDGLATGLMLISRTCLMRLIQLELAPKRDSATFADAHGNYSSTPYYEFFRSTSVDGRLVGEDHYFCELVRASGGTVLGCPWVPVTHTGRFAYRGDLPGIAQYTAED